MPGFGVPAGLPGLPSPATGVPATPDFLSGLLQAAPAAEQGYQMGEQIKEQRRQRALQDLQQLAPYAVQDPKNPGTIKSIKKAFKALGLDPNAAMNADGSINTGALMQHNPYFGMFQSAITNPNANPNVLKWLAKKVGIQEGELPTLGTYTPKEVDDMVKNFQKNKELVGSGKYSQQQLLQDAQALQKPLQDLGRIDEAQSLLVTAQTAAPGQLTGAQIGRTTAQTNLIQEQAKTQAVLRADDEARVGLIKADTAAALHRQNLIDAQTYATYQRVNMDSQRLQQSAQRLDLERQKVSSQNLSTALRAASDYNKQVQGIQSSIDALTGHLTQLQNNGEMYENKTDPKTGQPINVLTPTAAVIMGQLKQLQYLQSNYKPVLQSDITNQALHTGGLPNTNTILPSTTPPQDLKGTTYTTAQVKGFAKQAGMSYQEALTKLRKRGATIKP